jgi:hypothetical protein
MYLDVYMDMDMCICVYVDVYVYVPIGWGPPDINDMILESHTQTEPNLAVVGQHIISRSQIQTM